MKRKTIMFQKRTKNHLFLFETYSEKRYPITTERNRDTCFKSKHIASWREVRHWLN
ncbi:hypothetical protein CLOSTASPAR_03617 [[Clostridium] asparagiforme DSM 15981]|uniref:Uncharacterized protein n=1 Tax=[Clostridium] asparagiforme DSM 15981 TaxID=518636 RepID=C0D2X7_9FIRM|nr:hypothetical protein CLOSTASPAR_03617 [[Clostridium] asparagiforme DSM 15981]